MNTIKNLAQYYVDLLVKLGILRFSILLALALVALALGLSIFSRWWLINWKNHVSVYQKWSQN